eukprot:TRINITY_DN82221_c0_g1_i1.p1 TRINITY_DN82221_c0_g1~~TRINITY_DN82221_c0_g1_i1.p1  ORF type:complete len:434 (+),score=119.95 TRINITY_DN82221_c0_g1_i1:166-1467(+)
MSRSGVRLMQELREWSSTPPNDLFLSPVNPDRLDKMITMLVGPPGSPYAYGMYLFLMTYPEVYPHTNMHCVCVSTSSSRVRWNPNIYNTGKVCLSTLGTWQGDQGEKWTSVLTTESILRTIQSLLNDYPYENEPGYEGTARDRDAGNSEMYNLKIAHEAIRLGVCELMEEIYALETGRRKGKSEIIPYPQLTDVMKQTFLNYYDQYMYNLKELKKTVIEKLGSPTASFSMMPFECSSNGMSGAFDFDALEARLRSVKRTVDDETEEWVREGKKLVEEDAQTTALDGLRSQLELLEADPVDGISVEAEDDCPFVLNLYIYGDTGRYEEGIFNAKMFLDPKMEQFPRVQFVTPIVHPGISVTDRRPFIQPGFPAKTHWTIRSILVSILRLLRESPDPSPISDLNPKIGLMWRAEKTKDEFKRLVRECVIASQEGL